MERRQLAKKEAKEARLKAKKKRRHHKAAGKVRANALALVTESVAPQVAPKAKTAQEEPKAPEAKTEIESMYTVQESGQESKKMFFAKALMYLRESLCDLVLACLDKCGNQQIVTCFKEELIGDCLEKIDHEHFRYESLKQLDFLHEPIYVGLKIQLCSVFHKSWQDYDY